MGRLILLPLATRLLLAAVLPGCDRHDVTLEPPPAGRSLSHAEQQALQQIADVTFREVKTSLDGLPERLTLLVSWGTDVIPETGESAAAGYPGNVGLTLDPGRDVLATLRTHLRPALVHELHHLARAGRVPSVTLLDQVVKEGLATAFERDFAKVDPPWGQAPPEILAWAHEVLAQPADAPRPSWLLAHPDGRRWVGMRVGTFLVDRACRASGRSPASLVFASTAEIVTLADLPP